MFAQQAALARRGSSQNRLVELKVVEIRRKFLRDHALRIVHLQQIAHALAAIGGSAVPNFRSEDDHIAGLAQDVFRADAQIGCITVGRAPSPMTAGDKLSRAKRFVEIIEIEVRGGNIDRDPYA